MKTMLKVMSVCLLVAVSLSLPCLSQEAGAQKLKIMKKKPVYQVSPKPSYPQFQFKCTSNPGLCQNSPCRTGVCGGSKRDTNGCEIRPVNSECQNGTVLTLGQEPLLGLCTAQGVCVDHKCLTEPSLCQNTPCLTGACGGASKNADGCAIAQAGTSCQVALPNNPGAYETGQCSAQGICDVPSASQPDFVPEVGSMAAVSGNICHPDITLSVPVTIKNLGTQDPALVGKKITVEVVPSVATVGCNSSACTISSTCQQWLKETTDVVLTTQGISSVGQTVSVAIPLDSSCLDVLAPFMYSQVDVKVKVKLLPGAGISESDAGNNSLDWMKVGSCEWQTIY